MVSCVCNANVPWAELELKGPPEAGVINRKDGLYSNFSQKARRVECFCGLEVRAPSDFSDSLAGGTNCNLPVLRFSQVVGFVYRQGQSGIIGGLVDGIE